MMRRLWTVVVGSLTLLAAATAHAQGAAASFPSKPMRFVVPFAAGGIADQFARTIASRLGDEWGQPVIVENRTGAGGNIGAEIVAKAPADGYTLVMGNIGTHAVNPFLFANMPFDSLKDFTPVALVIEAEGLLVVHPTIKAKTVGDLITLAKAEPGRLTYGSGGMGTTSHLAGELFKAMSKVDVTHVPYKGNVPAITDLVGGQTTMAFATMPTVMPFVRDGRLRAIAVIGPERAPALPEVPTVAESGLSGFEANNWIALFGPAGMPADVTEKLNTAVVKIMRSPDIQKRLETEGARFVAMSPKELGAFVHEQSEKWGKLLKETGTKPQ